MASINDKYRQFHQALIVSPEYLGIPGKTRKACVEFIQLATQLDKEPSPEPDRVEAAYVDAVDDARKLIAKGLLTVELPDEEQEGAAKTAPEASTTPVSHQKYEIHPTAAIFPMMPDAALNELAADIKEHGLRDPVVMHDRRVIDGRNRLEACHRAGVEPTFTEWTGSGSVVTWILSVNLHRRHLNDGQRAMIAGKVAQELTAEAKERSAQNLRKSGDPVEGLDPAPRGEGKSTERGAKLLNVSIDAAKKGAKIAKSGSNELVQAVTDGKVSLDAAAQVANLPQAKQREVVAKGTVQETAKKIREEKAESKRKKPTPEPETMPAVVKDEPQRDPPTPNDDTEPAADAKPKEPVAEETTDDEEEAHEIPHYFAPDDAPLLPEAHRAIDEMVHAGRSAQRMNTVTALLRKLIEFSRNAKAKLEMAVAP